MDIPEKLTICRQDVVVLSDNEAQENGTPESYRKKKQKIKVECIRKVQLTRMTADRIVPLCLRQRCRRAQYYHKATSKNTKYNKPAPRKKSSHCKAHRNKDDTQEKLPRKVYSPITIESSSDAYEDISSCSFKTISSDSDELEELIKTTRKRMKEEKSLFNYRGDSISDCSPITPESQYENILSDENSNISSIHSMKTVVLESNASMPSPPASPKHYNETNIKNPNLNFEAMLVHNSSRNNNNIIIQNTPSISSQENRDDSPVYEISGKVFMEHYLNTHIVCVPKGHTNC